MITEKTRRHISTAALLLSAFLLSAGIQAQAVFTPPTTTPPDADAYAPLTTSRIVQSKVGGLLLSTGNVVNGLLVQNGNVGIGTLNPTAKLDVRGEIKIGSSGATCTTSNVGAVRYRASIDTLEYCANASGTPVWKYVTPPPLLTINASNQCPNPNPNGGGNNCPPSNVGGAAASANRLCVLAGRSNYVTITNTTIAGNVVGGAYWNGSRWVSTSWGGGQAATQIVCQ